MFKTSVVVGRWDWKGLAGSMSPIPVTTGNGDINPVLTFLIKNLHFKTLEFFVPYCSFWRDVPGPQTRLRFSCIQILLLAVNECLVGHAVHTPLNWIWD